MRRAIGDDDVFVLDPILFIAFVKAKDSIYGDRDGNVEPFVATGLLDGGARAALAKDPMPYGVISSRPELETIARYDYEQGLAKRIVGLDELFVPEALNW